MISNIFTIFLNIMQMEV